MKLPRLQPDKAILVGAAVKSDRMQVRHGKECACCFSNTVFRQTSPPASLSSSSALMDPAALELKSAFTSAHVVYLYHRGQNCLIQVVAAATDHDVVALDAGTVPDDGRDKI